MNNFWTQRPKGFVDFFSSTSLRLSQMRQRPPTGAALRPTNARKHFERILGARRVGLGEGWFCLGEDVGLGGLFVVLVFGRFLRWFVSLRCWFVLCCWKLWNSLWFWGVVVRCLFCWSFLYSLCVLGGFRGSWWFCSDGPSFTPSGVLFSLHKSWKSWALYEEDSLAQRQKLKSSEMQRYSTRKLEERCFIWMFSRLILIAASRESHFWTSKLAFGGIKTRPFASKTATAFCQSTLLSEIAFIAGCRDMRRKP